MLEALQSPAGLATVGVTALVFFAVVRRVIDQLVTLRARSWVPIGARMLSRLAGPREYSFEAAASADGAPARCVERRRNGLNALASRISARSPRALAWSESVRDGLSDLRFTDVSRVPFHFAAAMRDRFNLCSVVTEASGPRLKTLDGHWTIDVGGSYGVNVAGYERYKDCIDRGWARVRELGAVLGPLHPVVAGNISALKAISGLDEVSFHMSGTEAVMAAARLVRFNTRRRLIVCFSGAYHGWWDGVQPGLGSERAIPDCLTLRDMDPASLAVIRRRAREIAGVFVNPVQSFHPNSPPPNDAVMLDSSARRISDGHQAYRAWLHALRTVCTEAGVPLVFDEVYTGFRLAPGGAQEFFDVRADMVVYGKTVGGGLPVGVVCGRSRLMRRFDPDHPMRMAYVVGTFSAHPAVMGAMREFLNWAVSPEAAAEYVKANARCATWVADTNQILAASALPVRLANLGTIWTVTFTERGRFNWLLQYYFRDEGISLSWVGTGRCLCSLDMTADDYLTLQGKLVAAAHQMHDDGWWLTEAEFPGLARESRSRLVKDMVRSFVRVPEPVSGFYASVMRRKHDDHHASHNDAANQLLHLVSSSVFLACYAIVFSSVTIAMWLGVPALLLRQFGHAVLEPDSHDAERLLLGYNTRNKTLILATYLLIPLVDLLRGGGGGGFAGLTAQAPLIAEHWLLLTMAVVWGRVMFLAATHDVHTALIWFVKLVTDPLTDLLAYRPWRAEGTTA